MGYAEGADCCDRCAEVDMKQGRGARGRSSTHTPPYMATLAALKATLCEVQSYHEQRRSDTFIELSPAQAAKMAALVERVESAAERVRSARLPVHRHTSSCMIHKPDLLMQSTAASLCIPSVVTQQRSLALLM